MMERGTLVFLASLLLLWNATYACFSHSTNSSLVIETGAEFYAECECSTPGYSVSDLSWVNSRGEKVELKRPDIDQIVYTEVNGSGGINLYITQMNKNVSGTYTCLTKVEDQIYQQVYNLEAHDPTALDPPQKQQLVLGTRSLIECKVHSESMEQPIVNWKKKENGKNVDIINGSKYEYSKDGLYINNVTMEDEGTYSCSAWDTEFSDYDFATIEVTVETLPLITAIDASPGSVVVVGTQLLIECKAEGNPPPTYVFEKFEDRSSNSSTWTQYNYTILIDRVKPDDQGLYKCQASNTHGTTEEAIFVDVLVAPEITFFPNVTIQENRKIKLVCDAHGRPPPNITITYVDDDDLEIYEEFVVQREHKGIYKCNATNDVDYEVDYMYLNVEYAPRLNSCDSSRPAVVETFCEETVWNWQGKTTILDCAYDSNPPSQMKWRYQSNEISPLISIEISKRLLESANSNSYTSITVDEAFPYGIYECTANNSLGHYSKIINYKEGHVPSVVTNATVLSAGHLSAIFAIEMPDLIEGPDIQGFTAEFDAEENYAITHIHRNRTWSIYRPYKIDALKPNTSYLIRFAAINEVGVGPWSEFLSFETPEPSVPEAPEWQTETDVVNIISTDQEIRWAPSEANGAPIQYYTLTLCVEDQMDLCNAVSVAANGDLKLDNSMLDFNQTYQVNLTAHNSVGDSSAANLTIIMLAEPIATASLLSAGALISISIVVVFVCLLLLDLLLLLWRRQGIIASCCVKKRKSKVEETSHTRDKKGLLKDNREPEETLRRPDNRHKEFEYNKTTGIITGRHSAV